MPRPSRYKYKIYKQLQSEIWGHILVKHKRNKITAFLLKQFESNLRQYKSLLKRWALKVFKMKIPKRFRIKIRNTFPIPLNKNNFFNSLIKIKNSHSFNLIFKYAFLIRKRLHKAWHIRQRQKHKISKFLQNKAKLKPRKPIVSQSSFPKKKIKFLKKRKTILYNFRSLYLTKSPRKKSKINWLNIKLIEKKHSYFYGFTNVKKFKILQDSAFYINKLRVNAIFKIEGMLSTLLFRLNWVPSCYMARIMVGVGCIAVDNIKIFNANYNVKIFQNISHTMPVVFHFIQQCIRLNVERGHLLLNVPNYIEINYRIMHACFWRYPLKTEIVGPYSFPFGKAPFEWSVSSIPVRR